MYTVFLCHYSKQNLRQEIYKKKVKKRRKKHWNNVTLFDCGSIQLLSDCRNRANRRNNSSCSIETTVAVVFSSLEI